MPQRFWKFPAQNRLRLAPSDSLQFLAVDPVVSPAQNWTKGGDSKRGGGGCVVYMYIYNNRSPLFFRYPRGGGSLKWSVLMIDNTRSPPGVLMARPCTLGIIACCLWPVFVLHSWNCGTFWTLSVIMTNKHPEMAWFGSQKRYFVAFATLPYP